MLVRLREVIPPEHVEALRAGTLDVAVVREPDPEEGITAMPVLSERFLAAVPADHALAGRRSIRVGALRDEPFVLFPRESAPGLYRQVLELCRAAGFDPRVVQEAEAWHTIISLVEAGIGISLIPASFEGRRTGALAYLALTGRAVHHDNDGLRARHRPIVRGRRLPRRPARRRRPRAASLATPDRIAQRSATRMTWRADGRGGRTSAFTDAEGTTYSRAR